MTTTDRPATAAVTAPRGAAVTLLRGGEDRRARVHLRLLVVAVVRLGVAAMETLALLDADVGGPLGPAVLVWLVLSGAVVAGGALAGLRRHGARDRWPGPATETAVAVVDGLAYAAVASTSPGGYGPIVVLGMMLLAQVPMRWGARGALLGGVPLTAVSLAFPSGLVTGPGGRAALVLSVAAAVGLGLALRRFLDRVGAAHERTQHTLSLVFDHSPTPTAITTASGDLVQVNPAMCALTDLAPHALVGTPLRDHVHPDDTAELGAMMAQALLPDGGTARGSSVLLRLRGPRAPRCVEVVLGVVPAGGGLPAQLVVQACDVEDQRAAAERLEHEASHDALTGLPNRRALHRALDAVVAEPGARGALVLVDLDGLKAVNDRYGHERGDDLLLVAAERISACLRPGDVAARLAGDEMVVLAHDVEPGDALAVGRRVLAALQGPATLGGEPVELRASAGVRPVTGLDDPRTVLRDADTALYEAKRCGGSAVRLAPHPGQLLGAAPLRSSARVRSAAAGA